MKGYDCHTDRGNGFLLTVVGSIDSSRENGCLKKNWLTASPWSPYYPMDWCGAVGGGSWLTGPPPPGMKARSEESIDRNTRGRPPKGPGGTPVVEEAHHVGGDHVGELQAVDGQQLQERGRGGGGGGRGEGVGPPPARG